MSRHYRIKLSTAVFIGFAVFATTAKAQTAFSSFGPANSFGPGGYSFGNGFGYTALAFQFTAQTSGVVSSVDVAGYVQFSQSPTVDFAIYADDQTNIPGSLLGSQSFDLPTTMPSQPQNIAAGNGAVALISGKQYWFALQAGNPNYLEGFAWYWDPAYVDDQSANLETNGQWDPLPNKLCAFRINVTPAAVPEPTSLMALSGMLGLGGLGMRRSRLRR